MSVRRLVLAVLVAMLLVLAAQGEVDKGKAADTKVDFDFIIVANENPPAAAPWEKTHADALMLVVRAIFLGEITFNWPKNEIQPLPDPFKRIPDPQKDFGGNGDVKVPNIPDYLPEHEHGLLPGKFEEHSKEARAVCDEARRVSNPGTLPVALIQKFIGTTGQPSTLLGVTFVNGHKQPGFCILLSAEVQTNPVIFAHELGHALCLGHFFAGENLMQPFKANMAGTLSEAQRDQLCPKAMQQKASGVGPVGGVAELPDVAGTPLEASGSSGLSTGALAGIAASGAVAALALGGGAWYARGRWLR